MSNKLAYCTTAPTTRIFCIRPAGCQITVLLVKYYLWLPGEALHVYTSQQVRTVRRTVRNVAVLRNILVDQIPTRLGDFLPT